MPKAGQLHGQTLPQSPQVGGQKSEQWRPLVGRAFGDLVTWYLRVMSQRKTWGPCRGPGSASGVRKESSIKDSKRLSSGEGPRVAVVGAMGMTNSAKKRSLARRGGASWQKCPADAGNGASEPRGELSRSRAREGHL